MGFIHNEIDNRNIAIKNIGICKYKIPIIFKNKNIEEKIISEFKVSVSLDDKTKGAHLSRIIYSLDKDFSNQEISLNNLEEKMNNLQNRIESKNSNLEMKFTLIFNTLSPITKEKTYLNSDVTIVYEKNAENIKKKMAITSVGAMLCPNSKKISDYGAHSQKCIMKIIFTGEIEKIDIEKIFEASLKQFSCEVFGYVRSSDEKYMTEKAYENPKFSEDLIRDSIISIKKLVKDVSIRVEIENIESIHQHNVFAIGEQE